MATDYNLFDKNKSAFYNKVDTTNVMQDSIPVSNTGNNIIDAAYNARILSQPDSSLSRNANQYKNVNQDEFDEIKSLIKDQEVNINTNIYNNADKEANPAGDPYANLNADDMNNDFRNKQQEIIDNRQNVMGGQSYNKYDSNFKSIDSFNQGLDSFNQGSNSLYDLGNDPFFDAESTDRKYKFDDDAKDLIKKWAPDFKFDNSNNNYTGNSIDGDDLNAQFDEAKERERLKGEYGKKGRGELGYNIPHTNKEIGATQYTYGPLNRLARWGISGLKKETEEEYITRELEKSRKNFDKGQVDPSATGGQQGSPINQAAVNDGITSGIKPADTSSRDRRRANNERVEQRRADMVQQRDDKSFLKTFDPKKTGEDMSFEEFSKMYQEDSDTPISDEALRVEYEEALEGGGLRMAGSDNSPEDIERYQKLIGMSKEDQDGVWGKRTQKASDKWKAEQGEKWYPGKNLKKGGDLLKKGWENLKVENQFRQGATSSEADYQGDTAGDSEASNQQMTMAGKEDTGEWYPGKIIKDIKAGKTPIKDAFSNLKDEHKERQTEKLYKKNPDRNRDYDTRIRNVRSAGTLGENFGFNDMLKNDEFRTYVQQHSPEMYQRFERFIEHGSLGIEGGGLDKFYNDEGKSHGIHHQDYQDYYDSQDAQQFSKTELDSAQHYIDNNLAADKGQPGGRVSQEAIDYLKNQKNDSQNQGFSDSLGQGNDKEIISGDNNAINTAMSNEKKETNLKTPIDINNLVKDNAKLSTGQRVTIDGKEYEYVGPEGGQADWYKGSVDNPKVFKPTASSDDAPVWHNQYPHFKATGTRSMITGEMDYSEDFEDSMEDFNPENPVNTVYIKMGLNPEYESWVKKYRPDLYKQYEEKAKGFSFNSVIDMVKSGEGPQGVYK